MRLAGHGIEIELPPGWEGEVYSRGPGSGRTLAAGETSRSVAHFANFALPARRGDYGSGAVELMREGDMLMILFEFEPASTRRALFRHKGPPEIRSEDFDANRLQRTLPGQAGVQYFFQTAGRAFCLYLVLGAESTRENAAVVANTMLRDLIIGAKP